MLLWIGVKYVLCSANEKANLKGVFHKYLIGVALIVLCSTIASGVANLAASSGDNTAQGIVNTGIEFSGIQFVDLPESEEEKVDNSIFATLGKYFADNRNNGNSTNNSNKNEGGTNNGGNNQGSNSSNGNGDTDVNYNGNLSQTTLDNIDKNALNNENFRKLIEEADKHLGKSYEMGAKGPDAFDCSGFVSYVFTESGVKNIGTSAHYIFKDHCKEISESELQPGDLIFFEGTYDTGDERNITHVGIYVGNGNMLHAGKPVGYLENYVDSDLYKKNFYTCGRVVY